MDEATIRQMMQEYSQAMRKAAYLKEQIENAGTKLEFDVVTDEEYLFVYCDEAGKRKSLLAHRMSSIIK